MGAPSVHPDVMASGTLQASALMRVIGSCMAEVWPLVLSANFGETEHFRTINDMLHVVWFGQSNLGKVIGKVRGTAATVLARMSREEKRLGLRREGADPFREPLVTTTAVQFVAMLRSVGGREKVHYAYGQSCSLLRVWASLGR